MNILLYTALFVAFIPGLLFKVAIPKQKYGAIIAHAVLFTIAVYILQRIAKQYPMLEGFESTIEIELNTARTQTNKIIAEIDNKLKDRTLPTNIRNSLKDVLNKLTTRRGNLKQLSERLARDLNTLKIRQDAVARLSASATTKMRNDATAAVKRAENAINTSTTNDIKRMITMTSNNINEATVLLASAVRTSSNLTSSFSSIIPGGASLSMTLAQNTPTLAPAPVPTPAPPTTLARQGSSSSMAIRMGSSSSMPQPMAPQPAYETSIQSTVNRAVGATLPTTTTMPRFGM